MNRKKLEEFEINKQKKQAEDTAFAIEANKGAEEKERQERASFLKKQKEYAIALK